jgi:hypothetical protein
LIRKVDRDGKARVHAWADEGNLDLARLASMTAEIDPTAGCRP